MSPVHLRDVPDKVGKMRTVPTLAQRQLSLLLIMVVVVVIVVIVTIASNIFIGIIVFTIVRTAAT